MDDGESCAGLVLYSSGEVGGAGGVEEAGDLAVELVAGFLEGRKLRGGAVGGRGGGRECGNCHLGGVERCGGGEEVGGALGALVWGCWRGFDWRGGGCVSFNSIRHSAEDTALWHPDSWPGS